MSLRTLIRVAAAALVLAIVCLVLMPNGTATEDVARRHVISGAGMHAA